MNQLERMKGFLENNKMVLIGYMEKERKVFIDLTQKKENGHSLRLEYLKFSTKRLCAKDILYLESQEFKKLFYYEIIEICDMYNKFVRERGLFDDALVIDKLQCSLASSRKISSSFRDGGVIEWNGRRYMLSEIKD